VPIRALASAPCRDNNPLVMGNAYLAGAGIALGIIVAIVLLVLWVAMWQDRIEHADAEKTTEQEWAESRFSDLPRTEFVLYRIIPAGGWTLAEYIFQRDDRSELARFVGRSRARATFLSRAMNGSNTSRPTAPMRARSEARRTIPSCCGTRRV
jgi:hypothetical protein